MCKQRQKEKKCDEKIKAEKLNKRLYYQIKTKKKIQTEINFQN